MTKKWPVVVVFALIPNLAFAEAGLKKRRPLPHEYGRVVLTATRSSQELPDVPFEHWLHRAKFTCRLCHVDLGFAMRRNGTGITAEDNARGYYCGTCHNGTLLHEGRAVFGACATGYTEAEMAARCLRCHSAGEKGRTQYDFHAFTRELPKGRFGNGVDWEKAEEMGMVQPVDYLEGVSFRRTKFEFPDDFDLAAKVASMPEIRFSHRKHTVWSGCEGCHPEIFAGVKKGATKYSMVEIFEGRYCGQCHQNVAFPTSDCQRCHTRPVQ